MRIGSKKKFWFKCPAGPDHEWEAQLSSRTNGESGCPCCANRKASVTNSLASLFPDMAKLWHPTRNGELRPQDIFFGSTKVYWWLDNGREFQLAVRDMTLGSKTRIRREFTRLRSL
jgi:hypothetical protein